MSSIAETIKKNRPNLAAGSVKLYVSQIENLAKRLEIKLEQPKDAQKHLKKIIAGTKAMNPRQRKTLMASLVVWAEKEAADAVEKFRDVMGKDSIIAKEEDQKLEMTDKQRDAWLDFDEVMKKYQQLEREVKPLMSFEKLSPAQFQRVQLYVLTSLIFGCNLPPRRSQDYLQLKHKNFDAGSDNYYDSKRHQLVFNTYKTSKTYGTQQTQPDLKLRKILKDWSRFQDSDYVFTYNGKPMTNNKLNDILYSFFDGKKIGITMLRHVFISHKLKNVPMDLLETAKEMGHSLEEQMLYRKKA